MCLVFPELQDWGCRIWAMRHHHLLQQKVDDLDSPLRCRQVQRSTRIIVPNAGVRAVLYETFDCCQIVVERRLAEDNGGIAAIHAELCAVSPQDVCHLIVLVPHCVRAVQRTAGKVRSVRPAWGS